MPPPTWTHYVRHALNGDVAYLTKVGNGPVFRIDRNDGGTTGDVFAFPEIAAGFRGGLSGFWAKDENLYVTVGPPGGGPHVRGFDRFGNLTYNEMAGDATQVAAYVPAVAVVHLPVLTTGAGFLVRMAFEGRRSASYWRTVFNTAAALLVPAGFRMTTERPQFPVAKYGQVIFDAPYLPELFEGFFPGPRWDSPIGAVHEARCVYIMPQGNPELAGLYAAHEVGHAFGLQHRDDKTVMAERNRIRPFRWHPDDLTMLKQRSRMI
jgi:hypothetical protein